MPTQGASPTQYGNLDDALADLYEAEMQAAAEWVCTQTGNLKSAVHKQIEEKWTRPDISGSLAFWGEFGQQCLWPEGGRAVATRLTVAVGTSSLWCPTLPEQGGAPSLPNQIRFISLDFHFVWRVFFFIGILSLWDLCSWII